jgi:hypothetical protein
MDDGRSDHRSPGTSPRRQPVRIINLVAAITARCMSSIVRFFQGCAHGPVFQIGQPTLTPTVSKAHDATHRIIATEFLADGIGEDRAQQTYGAGGDTTATTDIQLASSRRL